MKAALKSCICEGGGLVNLRVDCPVLCVYMFIVIYSKFRIYMIYLRDSCGVFIGKQRCESPPIAHIGLCDQYVIIFVHVQFLLEQR